MKQLQITTLFLLLLTTFSFADSNHNHGKTDHSGKMVQMKCPVMGGEINKAIYTEYKGEKVYFCCDMCIGKFNESPEKYINGVSVFNDDDDNHDDID